MLKQAIEIDELMVDELSKRITEFSDIIDALDSLSSQFDMLEQETNGKESFN